jgi:hypothetical protein
MVSVLARALLVVCCFLVAACNCCVTPAATLAPGALTEELAIAAALRQAPTGMANPTAEWASPGQNPFISTPGAPVWLVRLVGASDIPTCAPGYLDRALSPSDAPCLDNQQGKEPNGLVAVLDPSTGVLIGWSP